MPFVAYVKLEDAAAMVKAINESRTELERREAQLRCEGYMRRCKEMGQMWPGCGLDNLFANDDRPTCCGEYLDWRPT